MFKLIVAMIIIFPVLVEAKTTIGWLEMAVVNPGMVQLKARIDTGAKTSSINAKDISSMTVNGKKFYRFIVTNKKGVEHEFRLPFVRYGRIKRDYGKVHTRPVVMMAICVGNVQKNVEVNLMDRANKNYPLLLGRTFLKDDFLVDSTFTYLNNPSCKY